MSLFLRRSLKLTGAALLMTGVVLLGVLRFAVEVCTALAASSGKRGSSPWNSSSSSSDSGDC
jgi:hypothetical protein